MLTLKVRGVVDLIAVRQRAAKSYAMGEISKKLLDEIDITIDNLIRLIAQAEKADK